METVHCDSCRHEVPARNWCVRCGSSLAEETGTARGRRDRFAAAPGERLGRPTIVSSLFPQLPSDSMATFRVSLALGAATVVALAALGLFPVALIAAVVLVPLITVIYLYDVDVYEDQPLYVVGLTMFGGALGGVAVALLARALAPADASFASGYSGEDVLVRGVLIPLVSTLVILLPALALLRYPKFNDVLDGSTFGAASAISFTAAEVFVTSLSFLASGLSPDGVFVGWTLRLLTIALAAPVLTAAVMGSAAGALWLRYRAPVEDRAALGALGRPAIALPAAALVLVGAALAQLYLPAGASLAVLAVLAAAGLVWLRRVIHLGLIQEAGEREVGPDITCVNCGRPTPQHTFCGECGVALGALPKGRPPEPPTAPAEAPA